MKDSEEQVLPESLLFRERGCKVFKYDQNLKAQNGGKIYDLASYKYEVYLKDTVTKSENYSSLCDMLRNTDETNTVNFYLHSFGGSCHGAINLINAMLDCKAYVHVHITAPCYSAGATIALCGDSLKLRRNTYLMFHNYSAAIAGKGKELSDHVDASNKWIKGYMRDLHQPFLTKRECDLIEKDNDIRVWADDKDLKQRISRHFGE